MLENNERINFSDLFEPPEGFELEHVWGTSYSISLAAYLMVLLAMENRGRVPEISKKEKISNAQCQAIIERNQKKITLLALAGYLAGAVVFILMDITLFEQVPFLRDLAMIPTPRPLIC